MDSDGELLRQHRLAANLTIDELANRVGIEAAFLSALERGERTLSQALLLRLQKELGVNLDRGEDDRVGIPDNAPRSSPYKGLYSYTINDERKFFGREPFIQSLIASISYSRFSLVAGPSGSGKSSLVSAGVLSRLRTQDDTAILSFRPGHDPLSAMANSLTSVPEASRSGTLPELYAAKWRAGDFSGLSGLMSRLGIPRLVIFVDQLEEIFRISSEADRDRFGELLAAMENSVFETDVRVVSSLRADFLGSVAAHRLLSRLFSTSIHLVPPLNEQEIEDIILRPIDGTGVTIDPHVVSVLRSEIFSQPTALPILSFCLETLWNRRRSSIISADDLDKIGGFSGLLASIAETRFTTLSPDEREAVKHLMLQMVAFAPPGTVEPDTKRRLTVASLSAEERQLVDQFVAARLLAADADAEGTNTVEFAHETLMTSWPRLAGWIAEDGENARFYQTLEGVATVWLKEGRQAGLLWSGPRLEEANRRIGNGLNHHIGVTARAFVDECNRVQQVQDITEFNRLSMLLEAQPDGVWGDLVVHFAELGRERLARVFSLLRRELDFREKVVLASVGIVDADDALQFWELIPAPEFFCALKVLRNASALPSSLLDQIHRKVAEQPLAMLAACVAHATPDQLPPVDTGAVRFELDQLAPLLEQLPTDIANEAVFNMLVAFPVVLDALVKPLYAPEDAATFARCFLALRSAAQRSSIIKARLLPIVPLRMFDEFHEIHWQGEARSALAYVLSQRRSPREEAQYAAAVALAGDPSLLVHTLGDPEKIEASSWITCYAKELGLAALNLNRIDADIGLATASPSLAFGHMIQLLDVMASDNPYVEANLQVTASRMIELIPSAFVVAAAEWLFRRKLEPGALADAISLLPQTGLDYFTVQFADDQRLRFVRIPNGTHHIGIGSSSEHPIYLDSQVSAEATIAGNVWIADRLIARVLYEQLRAPEPPDQQPEISHVSPNPDCPVVAITWHESCAGAAAISSYLDDKSRWRGRLPYEAEWEAAVRNGVRGGYCFGDDPTLLPNYAWYASNAENRTHPGALKRPNSLGLFDVHGNCWEWCENGYAEYLLSDALLLPADHERAALKALRGGCWNLSSEYARSFTRNAHTPSNRNYYLSFRPVLEQLP